MPLHNLTEYTRHCNVAELVDGDGVEVTEEARSDGIAAPTRGTHGGYELHIHQLHGGVLLEVVPVPVVQPLPQELNGRLGTVHLSRGHVQVINKHNLKIGKWRIRKGFIPY